MPDIHAKFSPSASDRLIHCPLSLLLGEQYGPEDTGSEYSREGTEAHSLGEFLLKKALGLPCEDPRPTLKMYSPEMQECAEGYRDPKWGSFTKNDYLAASRSVDEEDEEENHVVQAVPGSFDFRKFDVISIGMFEEQRIPAISLQKSEVKFSMSCVKGMACDNYIELLVHPIKKMIAIRPTTKENRCAIQWTSGGKSSKEPRNISCKAYIDTLFQIFGWNPDYKFKLYGCIYREGKDAACIFTTTDAGVYIKKDQILAAGIDVNGKFLSQSGKRIRAVTRSSDSQFGPDYYEAKSMRDMVQQTREEWQTRIDGQLCSTGEKLNVTPYEELRAFIQQELGELFEEVQPE